MIRSLTTVLAGTALALCAEAQYSARSTPVTVPGIAPPSAGGGWLGGSDDCAAPHTNLGTGTVLDVPFTTGTTGTTGQNETVPGCPSFGTRGIDNDVWFDWTADASGFARVSTCGGTSIDTKIGIWPDNSPASCPPDGTSLACNDDACSLQSSVDWPVMAGTTYTIQLGTFHGASGGSGTFDVEMLPPTPCGHYDDGTTENALGLTAGGELGWYHGFTCTSSVGGLETAYGSAMFPGSVTNGSTARAAVYEDTDLDPSSGATLLATATTVVVNGDTDILNPIPMGSIVTTSGVIGILATADHTPGEFPGPMDQDIPTPRAWVVGNTAGPGTLDLADLANNSVPPLQMSSIGFPATWLLRTLLNEPPLPGFCYGDGSGAACGCGNESSSPGGCLNGLGVGSFLGASGNASTANDTLVLEASGVPTQPGLFFQGDTVIAGGDGVTFGDGIRCCGQNVVRLEIVVPSGPEPATATSSVTISQEGPPGTVSPGDTKCYQYWYRDPAGSPCGTNFNLSSAQAITWS